MTLKKGLQAFYFLSNFRSIFRSLPVSSGQFLVATSQLPVNFLSLLVNVLVTSGWKFRVTSGHFSLNFSGNVLVTILNSLTLPVNFRSLSVTFRSTFLSYPVIFGQFPVNIRSLSVSFRFFSCRFPRQLTVQFLSTSGHLRSTSGHKRSTSGH